MAVIRRFQARSDSGTTYVVIEYGGSRIDTSHLNGKSSLGGLSVFRTSNGGPVNKIDDETFKIVRTGETVRKIS